MNPMVASSAIHNPTSTISDVEGTRKFGAVVRVVLVGHRDREGPDLGRRLVGGDGDRPPSLVRMTVPGGGPIDCPPQGTFGGGPFRPWAPAEVEVADDLVCVRRRPAVQGGSRQPHRDVDAVVVELRRRGEHAHRADDRVADRHHGDDDGQPGRDPGEIQGQTGAARDDQVAEHPLGEVDRPRRAADDGRHDEPEDVHETGHQRGEDAVAAGRPVGLGGDGMRDQPHAEEDDRECRCSRRSGRSSALAAGAAP